MKLKVSKDLLLGSLEDIQGIVERKSAMPILSHFLFDCTGEIPLLYATDLETAIRETIEVKAEKKGVVAIPARPFISIVKELEGEITLEEGENFSLKISSGNINFNLACLDPKEFPNWPDIDPVVEINLRVDLLRTLIEKTVYAASDSDTRYVFNGILLHLQRDSLRAVGTDGHRLALYKSNIDLTIGGESNSSGELKVPEEVKVILPKKAVSELRRLIEAQMVTLKIGKNHVLVKTPGIEFLTKVIEGTYPNYEQVIPRSAARRLRVEKEALEKALRRVSIISRERSNAVKFELSPSQLLISASNPDLGTAEERLPVDFDGDPFTIGFNARYILDSLDVIEKEWVIMEFNDPLGPSLLKGEDDEEYLSVIMPMRI
jgi:DNA polymerase-3 subunit beta